MKYTIVFAAAAGLVLALAPAARAGLVIDNTGITVTTDSERYAEHAAIFAVDGSNFTGVYPDELAGSPTWGAWLGSNSYPTWISVNLGGIHDLEMMRVWNGAGGSGDRSAREVEIYYSADPTAPGGSFGDAKWTQLGTAAYTFTARGAGYNGPYLVSDEIDMTVTAQLVALNVLNNYGDGYGPHISELQFIEVPEPATVALLSIGGLGMLIRRRRRWS